MKSRLSRISALAAAVGASAALLVGCGGSTVTSDDITAESSVAPLERPAPSTSETDEAGEPGGSGSTGVAPAPEDRSAREISEIPDAPPATRPEDEDYLTGLADGGIDIAGVEDQLLGTATTVCASDGSTEVTASAVAGQLIEQDRTELTHDEATSLIVDTARATYCP